MDDITIAMERQRALEDEMASAGIERYDTFVSNTRRGGIESATAYGQEIIGRMTAPLAEAIEEWRATILGGNPRNGGRAARLIREHDALVVAYLAVKCSVDTVSCGANKLTGVALRVATAVEDEARFRSYREQARKLFDYVVKDLQKRTSDATWQRRVMIHVMNKHGFTFPEWRKVDKLHLGQALIGLLIEATGLWELESRAHKRKTVLYLKPRAELLDYIASKNARCSLLSPVKMPMVVPPSDWAGPYGGGYYFSHRPLPLITGRVSHNYLEELGANPDQLEAVYESLNAIQSTPWRINTKVRDVLREVWDRGQYHGKLPSRDPLPLPPKPLDIESNEEARKLWKVEASKVHTENARLASKRVMINRLIWLADKFGGEEALYFPYQLDFRGRVYATPQHLNPQGHDVAKALLTFAHGKPIEDERALGWLMVHGANTFGEDKVSLEDRIAWAEENTERVQSVAADPLGDLWWTEADKPWQFLAWCFEYAACLEHGWGYVSALPIQLDGTCNGLQHFSAMLRDPVGGAAVNLVPAEKPADIYQEVANRVIARLEHLGGGSYEVGSGRDMGEEWERANQWLRFGITRKLCKRPVMIVPYSGTMFAARQYIEEYAIEQRRAGVDMPWDDDYQAAFFLAPIVWQAIEETVVAARDAMAWLRSVAKACNRAKVPVQWTTPDGFPVMQAYWESTLKMVATRMGERRIRLSLKEEVKGELSTREQENGVAPNFVHSMDACALRQYVLLARDYGVESFCLIHDSYGTVAADTDVSSQCLRHAFVNLYDDADVLAEFRDGVVAYLPGDEADSVRRLPPTGALDVSLIRESQYFFA